MIGVRLSLFDQTPFHPDPTRATDGKLGPGIPDEYEESLPSYPGFGCKRDAPLEMDLDEPIRLR